MPLVRSLGLDSVAQPLARWCFFVQNARHAAGWMEPATRKDASAIVLSGEEGLE